MPDQVYETEHIKRPGKKPGTHFGGFQYVRISSTLIRQRLCCAADCTNPGQRQIAVPGGYRIVCGSHYIMILMMTMGILGHPNPVPEIREQCDISGVDFNTLLAQEPIHPTMPLWFRCLQCSGGLEENMEMRSPDGAIYYVHKCGKQET